jgi:hypothetical protein
MHTGLHVLEVTLQIWPVVFPCHAVHARGGLPLAGTVRLPQAVHGQMMD